MSGPNNHNPRTRLNELAPGIQQLRNYPRTWLRGDAIAGLTVLAYLIPQVLAYSGLVGLPPATGLATAMAALATYALLGKARIISVGPESTVALMAGLLIAPLAQGNPGHALALTATLTIITAAWLAIGWLVRAGIVSRLLTKPILLGYLTGGGLLMISSQLGKATKTQSSGDTIVAQTTNFLQGLNHTHWPTLAATAAVLLLLYAIPHIHRKLPTALLAIALATICSYAIGAEKYGLKTLGELPHGLPAPTLPHLDWTSIQTLALGGLSIALVSFSDVMLTARAFSKPGEPINANHELLALAGVHATSGLLGGYPSSASSSRTAIAKAAGANSQLHGLIAAGGVALVLLIAGPLFAHLPQAALAAVVIWAATKLIALGEYKSLYKFRKTELAVALATALGTATFGILPGIGIAVALSVVELLARLATPHEAIQGFVPGLAGMHDVDDYPEAVTITGLLVYRYDAPLFFGNSDDFANRLTEAVAATQPSWVVLNVEANMHVDFTAAEVLRTLISGYQEAGIRFGLARLKHDLRVTLERDGILELVGESMVFDTLPAAVKAYESEHPEARGPQPPGAGEPFQAQ